MTTFPVQLKSRSRKNWDM
uniref:Uncharacterized protein n=1 Tax=Arundo donax TaxID=35708 RepID=A0A0A9AEY8_ARUDO